MVRLSRESRPLPSHFPTWCQDAVDARGHAGPDGCANMPRPPPPQFVPFSSSDRWPNKNSQVPPLLIAALICDAGVADPSTGKKNLIGIFDNLSAPKFPVHREVTLYFKVTDAEGHYPVEIEFVDTSDGKVLAQVSGAVDAPNRLASLDRR